MIEVDSQILLIVLNLNNKLQAIAYECFSGKLSAIYVDKKLKSIENDVKVLRQRVDTALNSEKQR